MTDNIKYMKSPYDKFHPHPFKQLVDLRCPWADEFRSKVKKLVSDTVAGMKLEASNIDCNIDLVDEDFLYERFLDNRNYHMYNANWQVCKYFIKNLLNKIRLETIGIWKFTEHDYEMFSYFRKINFDKSQLCKSGQIRFSKDNIPYDDRYKANDIFTVSKNQDGDFSQYYYFQGNDYGDDYKCLDVTQYEDVVHHIKGVSGCIADLIRNIKGLEVTGYYPVFYNPLSYNMFSDTNYSSTLLPTKSLVEEWKRNNKYLNRQSNLMVTPKIGYAYYPNVDMNTMKIKTLDSIKNQMNY